MFPTHFLCLLVQHGDVWGLAGIGTENRRGYSNATSCKTFLILFNSTAQILIER